MSDSEDQRWINSLHRTGPGAYRVGASPLVILHHEEGDWGVYHWSLEGLLRVRGAWAFDRLRDARARGFAVARELGYT